MDFLGAAHAGGVDKLHRLAAVFPGDGDGIAGEARFRPGDDALLAEQVVQKRGLADVGLANDGEAQRAVGLFGRSLHR